MPAGDSPRGAPAPAPGPLGAPARHHGRAGGGGPRLPGGPQAAIRGTAGVRWRGRPLARTGRTGLGGVLNAAVAKRLPRCRPGHAAGAGRRSEPASEGTSRPAKVRADRERDSMDVLASAAAALVGPGKGILAADESIATMSSRLAAAGVAPTAKNRCAFREMLVTTPRLAHGISGVLLCDETFGQRLGDGRPFPAALAEAGAMAGLTVYTSHKTRAATHREVVTGAMGGAHSP